MTSANVVTPCSTLASPSSARVTSPSWRQMLRRAAELYRGLLLEGAEPSDCPGFDEWLFFQRDYLEQRAVEVLPRLLVPVQLDERPAQVAECPGESGLEDLLEDSGPTWRSRTVNPP